MLEKLKRFLPSLPVSWLRQECEAGRLPHVRAGKAFLFNPESMPDMLAAKIPLTSSPIMPTGMTACEASSVSGTALGERSPTTTRS